MVSSDGRDHGLSVQRERHRHGHDGRQLLVHYSTSAGKVFQHGEHRIGRRLAQAADRRVHHRLRQLLQERGVPPLRLHQLERLDGADPARRALAARLFGEELHHVARRAGRGVVVRQHDDRRRSDEAAVFVQGVEVERHVGLRRRQDPSGRAAGKIAVELVPVEHAAAVFVDELTQRDARRSEVHARLLDAAADRERAQSLPAVAAVAGKPRRPFLENVAHPVQRLHVVLERGTAEQADLRHVRRAQARLAALALDRFDHRGLFAADVRAGAASQMDRRNAHTADSPAAPRSRARGSRGSRDTRREGRCRSRRCRPPTPRSARLRESGADRARGSSDP